MFQHTLAAGGGRGTPQQEVPGDRACAHPVLYLMVAELSERTFSILMAEFLIQPGILPEWSLGISSLEWTSSLGSPSVLSSSLDNPSWYHGLAQSWAV